MKKAYVAPNVICLLSFEAKDVITASLTQEEIYRDPFVSDWE